jgi:hypothetical protein
MKNKAAYYSLKKSIRDLVFEAVSDRLARGIPGVSTGYKFRRVGNLEMDLEIDFNDLPSRTITVKVCERKETE